LEKRDAVHPHLATAGRIALGAASVLVGIGACVGVLAAAGRADLGSVLLAFGLLVLGFLGLAVTRERSAPWRPLRFSLAVASLVSGYMASALPWPPRGTDLGSTLVLVAAMLVSAVAALLPNRFPRFALALLTTLAAYGVFILTRFGRGLAGAVRTDTYAGPAIVLSFTMAASVGAAWIASVWHGRFLVRAVSARGPDGAA